MINFCSISSLFSLLFLAQLSNVLNAQTFVSEVWSGSGGQSAVFQKNVTVTDANKNVYVAGSTYISEGNYDIILQKFNPSGTLLWQKVYGGAAGLSDYAADIFVDQNLDIYITGTVIESVNNNYDLVVLKYSSAGTLLWHYEYNNGGSNTPYDAGTAIIGDNQGKIFVTGGSFGVNTFSDYVLIKLSTSNASPDWIKRYDYAQLNDIPGKIALTSNEVVISGGSQITTSPERWEMASVIYDRYNGNYITDKRSAGNATSGVDEIYDIVVSGSGSIHLTGAVKNTSTDYDIKIIKLDENYNIIWEQELDSNNDTDKGFGIVTDNQNNVYVAGYSTSSTSGKNSILLKYNSSGTLQWKRELDGKAHLDDEAVQLVLKGGVLIVAAAINNDGFSDYAALVYDLDGNIISESFYKGPDDLEDKPSDIAVDVDGNIIITGMSQLIDGTYKNKTVKYSILEKAIASTDNNGNPLSYNNDELLIKFSKSSLKLGAIDNLDFKAGKLSDFISSSTI